MLLHDIMTSFSIYLFTVPVNLVYVKLWGLATKKILIKNLPCMIEKGTEGIRRQKQMKKFCLKGWSKSALSCSVVSTRDKSHTRTVVRECCKGDEASQWRNPKFDPRHAQTPLAIVIQIGTRDYAVDPCTSATVRHDPPRRFVSAHA